MINKKKVFAVILTGGIGRRVAKSSNNKLPKQFHNVCGKPVFIHCVNIYNKINLIDKIYLVINEAHSNHYKRFLINFNLSNKVVLVGGGSTRLYSVKNALNMINHKGIVVLQNGGSPATPPDLIQKCIRLASRKKAVTAFIPAFYTTFEKEKNKFKKALDRKNLCFTCDPQVYDVDLLKKALEYSHKNRVKDKPTVELINNIGYPVYLVESSPLNIKITTLQDFSTAEAILKRRS